MSPGKRIRSLPGSPSIRLFFILGASCLITCNEVFDIESACRQVPHGLQVDLVEWLETGQEQQIDREQIDGSQCDQEYVEQDIERSVFAGSYLSLRTHTLDQVWNDQDGHTDQHQDTYRSPLGIIRPVKCGHPHVDAGYVQADILIPEGNDQVEDLQGHMPEDDDRAECDRLQHRKDNVTVDLEFAGTVNPGCFAQIV